MVCMMRGSVSLILTQRGWRTASSKRHSCRMLLIRNLSYRNTSVRITPECPSELLPNNVSEIYHKCKWVAGFVWIGHIGELW
jgi:hypothetical protein